MKISTKDSYIKKIEDLNNILQKIKEDSINFDEKANKQVQEVLQSVEKLRKIFSDMSISSKSSMPLEYEKKLQEVSDKFKEETTRRDLREK